MFRLARTTFGASARAAVRVSCLGAIGDVGCRVALLTMRAGCAHAELAAAAPEPQHSRVFIDESSQFGMGCFRSFGREEKELTGAVWHWYTERRGREEW
jgi:hypothetical protein